jgi:aminoglycoside phosphotransferase (APT) family kinase protein
MHRDEVPVDAGLVGRLLRSQLPYLAGQALTPVASSSTDHAIFRLGDDLAVRMPRIAWAAGQAALERGWLPRLAASLPVALPEHVASGRPGESYPFDWSVVTWLPGRPAGPSDRSSEPLVDDLAQFVCALRALDAPGAPARAPHQRGGVLAEHDVAVRASVAELGRRIDGAATLRAWSESVAAGPASSQVLSHGDLLPGNLLLRDDRLSAVIDWGGLGAADPAVDLLPAWNVVDAPRRTRLRQALEADEETWTRGRGWALQQAVLALPYYWDTNPVMVAQASYALEQVLAG